jgi:hypothetical protein
MEVAPPDVPVAAPWATEEMPQTTSCWLAEADPLPDTGVEPVALPAQTNWAAAGVAVTAHDTPIEAISARSFAPPTSVVEASKALVRFIFPTPNGYG